MSLKIALFVSFTLVLYSAANAFNITQLLDQYSDFSNFNNYLTQTGIASQINSRQTITVFVVDNGATSPLSGKPNNVLKNIMSLHVVLDYYDVKKLQNLPNKTDILTTLFQTSGLATGQQGFLNATDLSSGSVVIGSSAAKGATLGANLVKSIASQPYNISVLQISNVIIPIGIDNSKSNSSSPSPMSSSPPAPTPPKKSAPLTSPTSSSPPAPTPKKSPKKSAPPAATPAPVSSDAAGSPPKADGPSADALGSDAPAADKNSSGGTAFRLSLGVAIMIVSWTFFLTSIV